MARRKVKYYSAKRRAVYAAGEEIDHLVVFERDKWICGICTGLIDKRLRYPNANCGTLDHIVEIFRAIQDGWPLDKIHTYENVQAAHLSCNLDKSQNNGLHGIIEENSMV